MRTTFTGRQIFELEKMFANQVNLYSVFGLDTIRNLENVEIGREKRGNSIRLKNFADGG